MPATAPMQREPVGLAFETVRLAMPLVALALRLAAAGDESREARLIAASRRLRPAAMGALVAVAKALLLARERLAFTRQVRLRLAGPERLVALLARSIHVVDVVVT